MTGSAPDRKIDFRCPHKKALRSAVFNCIHTRPRTTREIEAWFGLTHATVQWALADLIDLEMIREADRKRNAIVYAAGL